MNIVNDWNRRRDEKRARMIAAARRRQMDNLLRPEPSLQSSPPTLPGYGKPTRGKVGAVYGWVTMLCVAGVFTAGLFGPFNGREANAAGLLIGAGVLVLCVGELRRHLRAVHPLHSLLSVLVVVCIAGAYALGTSGQVVINGQAQWRYSDAAKASTLAYAIRDDLYTLQENQSLLSYPPEQARSMLAYLEQAAGQADAIAARWNPATAPSDLPAPGFITVLEQVNSAADLQRRALAGYATYLRQPDQTLAEQITTTAQAAEQAYLNAAAELSKVVKPLGIELIPGGTDR